MGLSAIETDRLAVFLMGKASLWLHDKARRTSKFVLLAWNYGDVKLFTSEIHCWRFKRLNNFAVIVHTVVFVFSSLKTFEGIGLQLVFDSATGCVVIGCHRYVLK
ncbi:hypothetical protein HMPREF0281_00262 [Corynebacterium ammoniagenes DSM 20306]|uniref:Uncharacterized protein n=1 Tax=Corynebacterium ammoniagenes DSM 20306 TaxID=649754 RepID=A0ABN0AIU4_CORAM|nr:hypothetical protein HMPREF0281_00262 [Corynebacterium ammoniagenes DSM 20306]